MGSNFKPLGHRLLVKELEDSTYIKSKGGISYSMQEKDALTKFIKVVILEVGTSCEIFKTEDIGKEVLISNIEGIKIDKDTRFVNETNVFAFVP